MFGCIDLSIELVFGIYDEAGPYMGDPTGHEDEEYKEEGYSFFSRDQISPQEYNPPEQENHGAYIEEQGYQQNKNHPHNKTFVRQVIIGKSPEVIEHLWCIFVD
jgi:hypothetical protein